jgi:cell division protein FtsI/penicillin-binding protein 2
MASQPTYDPANFQDYEQNLYKNPVISEAYEPGSTFKVLVMSAALNEKVVTPETRCTICDGPYKVDKYYINTWNHKYYPNQTLTEVLEHSDNVGMVFVSQKLGKEKMLDYFDKFGIGKKTGIDLQDEASVPLKNRDEWSIVDTSTASFGQGLVVTGIQMIRAVSALANGGMLVEPHMASEIVGQNKSLEIKSKTSEKFLNTEAVADITRMMVEAVDKGEAKWAKPAGFQIAGKTGTAQIPVSGHYDETKTIASFVGFAPANNPKFIILTYLREPTSSPWGSETAAPLFFQIAKKLLIYYDIQPDK